MQRIKIFTMTRPIRALTPSVAWIPAKIKRWFRCQRYPEDDEVILLPEMNRNNDLQVADPNLEVFQNTYDMFRCFKKFCIARNFYGVIAFVLAVTFLVVGSGTYVGKMMRTSSKMADMKRNVNISVENTTIANFGQGTAIFDEYESQYDFENEMEATNNDQALSNVKLENPEQGISTAQMDFENDNETFNLKSTNNEDNDTEVLESNILKAYSHLIHQDLARHVEHALLQDMLVAERTGSELEHLSDDHVPSNQTLDKIDEFLEDESESDESNEEHYRAKRISNNTSNLEEALDFSNDTATMGIYPGNEDERSIDADDTKKKRAPARNVNEITAEKSINREVDKRFLRMKHERYMTAS